MFSYDPYAELATLRDFAPLELTSPDFEPGGPLPLFAWGAKRGGEDRSPALQWSQAPAGTKSFAVSCFDPDAPTGSGFWHWAAFNLPVGTTTLASGIGDLAALPQGATVLPNESRQRALHRRRPARGNRHPPLLLRRRRPRRRDSRDPRGLDAGRARVQPPLPLARPRRADGHRRPRRALRQQPTTPTATGRAPTASRPAPLSRSARVCARGVRRPTQ